MISSAFYSTHLFKSLLLAGAMICVCGCGRGADPGADPGGDPGGDPGKPAAELDASGSQERDEAAGKAPVRRYGIRSAAITAEITTLNPSSRTLFVQYFTDYGNIESRETSTSMSDAKVPVLGKTLLRDGVLHTLDHVRKTFTSMSLDDPANIEMDFSRIGRGAMRDVKIMETGVDTVLGFPCVEYAVTAPLRGLAGKFWVWNRIVLKASYDVSGYRIRISARTLEENPAIPEGAFDVPPDYKLQVKPEATPDRPF